MNNDQIKCLMAAIIFAAIYPKSGEKEDTVIDLAVDMAEKIGDKFSSTIV